MSAVKEQVRTLLDGMTEEDTWNDVLYKIHVVQKIEKSLKSLEEGRVVSHEEVRKQFLGK